MHLLGQDDLRRRATERTRDRHAAPAAHRPLHFGLGVRVSARSAHRVGALEDRRVRRESIVAPSHIWSSLEPSAIFLLALPVRRGLYFETNIEPSSLIASPCSGRVVETRTLGYRYRYIGIGSLAKSGSGFANMSPWGEKANPPTNQDSQKYR